MNRETTAQTLARRRREREAIEELERAARNQAPAGVGLTGALREARAQATAAGRGALDTLTFGHGDTLAAGLETLADSNGPSDWRTRYEDHLVREAAQSQYDASHYKIARTTGQVAGVVVPMVLTGGESAALSAAGKAGPRLAGAAARTGRELAAALGAGAGVGAGVQHVSDMISGRQPSWRSDLAAGAGGAADVAAIVARLGPGRAGGVNGAVTSAVEDLLNGRPISLQRASQSALGGHAIGGVAGELGRRGSDALGKQAKGRLGEALGAVRSAVNGMPREAVPKSLVRIEGTGRSWRPDGRSGGQYFEDKFGYGAGLTTNQRLARKVDPHTFNLYHFIPDDVGAIFAAPGAALGLHIPSDRGKR